MSAYACQRPPQGKSKCGHCDGCVSVRADVAALLKDGKRPAEIAVALGITPRETWKIKAALSCGANPAGGKPAKVREDSERLSGLARPRPACKCGLSITPTHGPANCDLPGSRSTIGSALGAYL